MLIIYADDDPEDVETFCDAIKAISDTIKCIWAKDGKEMLEILDSLVVLPDYVFLDINMPNVNGKECLRNIRADKRFRPIPVVIYTTSSRPADREELKQLGATDYIVKSNTFQETIKNLAPFFRSAAV